MKKDLPCLAIVVPCFNEEEVLGATADVLLKKVHQLKTKGIVAEKSFLVFVNDGSTDTTWQKIAELGQIHPNIKGINLARNFGHQAALLAGINHFAQKADCIVSIDADLQDDVEVIDQMLDAHNNGFDVVYGVRQERKTDSFFKRTTALFFYKIMRWLGVDIVYNHADFRLTSRRFNAELLRFDERNLFLRGIVPAIGLRQTSVFYNRKERMAGTTKYPFRKMVSFAFEGITSFSVRPLRIITISGLVIFILCVVLSAITIISFLNGNTVRGWASTVLPFYLLGGLHIFFLGIIGEYIGKIYKEIKKRPRYIIESTLE
ncbi:MAG: glycosyltransferase family 2 protein [Bacteroidota bacterium]|nr:MAG: glycosyltransferase family 2 protein [Bacteroidota bacterium]